MLDDLGEVVKSWWMRRQARLTPTLREEDTPEREDIVFLPLEEASATPGSFQDISESWIKAQSGESIYRRALEYVRYNRVRLLEISADHITAQTRGNQVWTQELTLKNGQLISTCGCSNQSTGNAGTPRPALGPCHHATAVLIMALQSVAASPGAAEPVAAVCPVTRQTLKPGMKVYRCRVCQMPYSAEGWQFLREMSNGECCGCGHRETIGLVTS